MKTKRHLKASVAILFMVITSISLFSCSNKNKEQQEKQEETQSISSNHTDSFRKINRKEFTITGDGQTPEDGENTTGTSDQSKYIIEEAPENPADVVVDEIQTNFVSLEGYTDVGDKKAENMDTSKFGTDILGFFQFIEEDKVEQAYVALDTVFTENSDLDPRVFRRENGVESTEDYMWEVYTLSNGPTNIKIAIGDSVKYKVEKT